MSMSRKHFVEIARIMREHNADGVLIRDIADFCYTQNEFFDRYRFYEACGLEDL